MYLRSKDPEHRNVIVLCLVHASVNVLKAIYETFKDSVDMSELILKQEFDHNPAFIMALNLAQFDQYRQKSVEMAEFLFTLMEGERPLPLENYTRYVNITDRLGRASLHMAC